MVSGMSAQTIATVANGLIPQVSNIGPALAAFSYVCGIVLGIKGILKFKENNESKGQVKMGIPIVLCIASALFLSLPKFMNVGIETIGFDRAPQSQFKF